MCPLFHTQHPLTLAQPVCCASQCCMGATSLHSNRGGHNRSAPTLVTHMVAYRSYTFPTRHQCHRHTIQRTLHSKKDKSTLVYTQLVSSFINASFAPSSTPPFTTGIHSSKVSLSWAYYPQRSLTIHNSSSRSSLLTQNARSCPPIFPFDGASSMLSIASPLFIMSIPSAKVAHTYFAVPSMLALF